MDEETKNETPTEEQEQTETKKDEKPSEESAETVTETAEEQNAPTLEQLQAENTQLRAEILRGRVEAEVMAQAPGMDVDPKSVPYLMKLCDLSAVVTDKGEVDKDAVTEAMKKVLDDLPALKKPTEQTGGFTAIGGNGQKQGTDTDEDRMRRWFGLKPKK